MYLTNKELEQLFHELSASIEFEKDVKDLCDKDELKYQHNKYHILKTILAKISKEQMLRSQKSNVKELDDLIKQSPNISPEIYNEWIGRINKAVFNIENNIGFKLKRYDQFR